MNNNGENPILENEVLEGLEAVEIKWWDGLRKIVEQNPLKEKINNIMNGDVESITEKDLTLCDGRFKRILKYSHEPFIDGFVVTKGENGNCDWTWGAFIRNKLTPFCNLIAMIRCYKAGEGRGESQLECIKKEASNVISSGTSLEYLCKILNGKNEGTNRDPIQKQLLRSLKSENGEI